MMNKTNMTRTLVMLHMGYGVGRLALGTVETTEAAHDSEQRGAEISDLVRRLHFFDVVSSSPAPTALAATVDGISADEATARLTDPVLRLEILGLRFGFLTAVAEEIVLGRDQVEGLADLRESDQADRGAGDATLDSAVGGFLPNTTVAYAREAFVEGVGRFCEDVAPRPRPVLILESHAGDVFDRYLHERVQWDPLQALSLSIVTVLGPTEAEDVMAFFTGQRKEKYGEDAGYQSFDLLLLVAEMWSGRIPPPEVRNDEMSKMTVSDLCDRLATDGLRIGRFCIAYGNDSPKAIEQTSEITRLIVARCTQGATPDERQRRLEAARDIFAHHATLAESLGENGTNEFLWCRVVGAGLAGLVRRS
jgi:hypothetical protein